jgi:hypothetical protein
MATINLGSIKFNWKGDYAAGTAYAVDDVVNSSGTSYVCIAASTGNAPPNATYWNVMAQGGTDISTTLTTQGDILYRDGSGLQRLAKGTAGKALLMNSSANAPEWGDAGGGLQSVQTFTTAGTHTYTKPSGISKIRVYITAGGGAGGGNVNSGYNYQGGQGGAAGGTAIKLLDASSITTVTVTVGTGGAGVNAGGGSNGATSSFGSHCSASGGDGGDRPGSFGGTQNGGVGSGGDLNLKGSAGAGAFESLGGAVISSCGGSSYWGGAGAGQWSANGEAGQFGSGGGGASSQQQDKPGANGGTGVCYVEEYA